MRYRSQHVQDLEGSEPHKDASTQTRNAVVIKMPVVGRKERRYPFAIREWWCIKGRESRQLIILGH